MSLEESTHKLGCSNLKVELIRVLLFNKSEIVSVKHVIFILNLLLIGERVVLRNTLKGLVDNIERLLCQVLNLLLVHETRASLIDDFLESLDLLSEGVSIQFLFHCVIEVSIVLLCHGVKGSSINVLGLGSLHETRQR